MGTILLVVFFGRSKIKELLNDVQKGMKNFKKGMRDVEDDTRSKIESQVLPPRLDPPEINVRPSPNLSKGYVPQQPRIAFVCYRREDSPYAASTIFEKLEANLGEGKVFKDIDSIPYGANFPSFIQECLMDCRYCLVVIGRGWLLATGVDGKPRLQDPDDHVRIEIETAFRNRLTVIPLYVDNATPPKISDLPESLTKLADLNGFFVRPGADLNSDIQRLAKVLKA